MKDSTSSKTRKGEREILSVSIPVPVYDALVSLCEEHNMNRSAIVASAIADYLRSLGIRIGEQ